MPADFARICPPSGPEPASTSDAPDAPAAWTAEERDRAVAALRGAPSAQAIPPPGPVAPLWEPTPGREVMAPSPYFKRSSGREPATSGPDPLVDVHDLLIDVPPAVEVTPTGQLVLAWHTARPVPAGSVSWGGVPPDQEVAMPRLRFHAVSEPSADGLQHRATLPLTLMVRPRYDPAGIARRGAGAVGWQIEQWDDREASARLFEGEAAFGCAPTPCDADASFRRLPAPLRGPQVDLPTPDGATITFDTDVPTAAAVWWRASGGATGVVISDVASTRHAVKLAGLPADSRVRYHVALLDAAGAVNTHRGGSFRLAPTQARPVRLAFMSDGRSGHGGGQRAEQGVNVEMTRGLLLAAWRAGAEVAFFAGDLVDGYTSVPADLRRQLQAWQHAVAPVGAHLPIFEGMGNHEVALKSWASGWQAGYAGPDASEAIFADVFTNPTNGPAPTEPGEPPFEETVYSVDYGPVHVAVLNTNHWTRSHPGRADHPGGPGRREGELSEVQLQWLDQDLAAARARGARHLVVTAHEPAFPGGGHASDAMYWDGKVPEILAMRDRLWAVLVRHEVLMAVFGDEHNYQRTRIDARLDPRHTTPVWHIVSGGVGAPYYARDETVPWAGLIEVFSTQQHFVLVTFDEDTAWLEARSSTGQLLDRVELVSELAAPR